MQHTPSRGRTVLFTLSFLLLIGFAVSLCIGRFPLPPGTVLSGLLSRAGLAPQMEARAATVLFNIRLPRTLLAMLVGCALSAAGAAFQGVFQNPMAAPDILGASSGAAFGAALAILLSLPQRFLAAAAFASSLVSVGLVFLVSRRARGSRPLTLILAGIMVSSLFQAGVSWIKLVADPNNQLPAITYWLMGSLAAARGDQVRLALLPMALGLGALWLIRWRMNLLAMGDEAAAAMGVHPGRIRVAAVLSASLLTAASVAVSGTIGWIGLVIPHLARRLTGSDTRTLLPVSMLLGALFLLLVDTLARSLLATEIPVGILTAFLGAPFFLTLILRREGAA